MSSPKAAATSNGETSTSSSKVTLKSSNGETFEVAIDVISQSQTIKHMIEDGCAADEFIPVPNVEGKVLAKVIEYCKKHHHKSKAAGSGDGDDEDEEKKKKEELRKWDIEFAEKMQDLMGIEVVLAANYLDIKGLFDLMTQKIADGIKDKSLGVIRKLFNLKNDFAPGEVEQLKKLHGDAGWNEADQ